MPPSQALAAGSFADVPILMGVNLDDGTFVPSCSLMDTNSDLQSFFQSQYGSASAVSSLLREYPDNVAQDCPFRPELYGVSPTDRFYGLTSQYKRCTAIETDLLFVAGMRSMLSAAAKRNTHAAYGYLWAQRTSNNGVAAKGVTHSCELGMVFNRPTLGGQSDAAAQRYASDSSITATTNHMVTSLLTFVNNGNPNSQNFPSWPAYGPKAQIMQFQGTYNTTVISDTYRSSQVNSLLSQVDSFGI
ncbi:hypothetical protein OC845_004957 [Tilletia horrida]|nr:hypothetical protein OC845_004957 [Tilletia horrida]